MADKCSCKTVHVLVLGVTWPITAVCRSHHKDTVHSSPNKKPFSSENPELFGWFDAALLSVDIARRSSLELEVACLLHELGHILGWMVGDHNNNSEATANLTAVWFHDVTRVLAFYRHSMKHLPRPKR